MAETTSSASIAPAPAIEKPGTGALVAAGRRRRRYSVLTRHDKLILTLMVGVPLAFDLALIWAPALWALQAADQTFAKLRVIAPNPLPASTADVGAAMLANEAFLRSSLDQAIASLSADGTIQAILNSNKFPAVSLK